ncbi:F-box protein [Quillaja saponaria]|uniref:F-box protein n=1 Tax=Quillaja saponaria TaxID=32244 RepID=A0AAD7Q9J4_QUISA|nr:F-box protein [Quillaja saponaria]
MDNSRETKKSGGWCNLPLELLMLIMAQLSFLDRIYVPAVCKNWSRVDVRKIPKLKEKFPSIFMYNWKTLKSNITSKIEYKLDFSSSFHKQIFTINLDATESKEVSTIPLVNSNKMLIEEFVQARPLASKYGWLLFAYYLENEDSKRYFFFNPITKETIKLPFKVDGYRTMVATFTSSPLSPECKVFAIHEYDIADDMKIHICTIFRLLSVVEGNRIEPLTDSKYYNLELKMSESAQSVVYDNDHEEFFVLTSQCNLLSISFEDNVGVMEVVHHICPWYTGTTPILTNLYMVWYEKDLIMIYFHPSGNYVDVCRFDWDIESWVDIYFTNIAIFVGCSSYATSIDIDGNEIEGRIYYQADGLTWYYSMETRNHYRCSEFYSTSIQNMKKVWFKPI